MTSTDGAFLILHGWENFRPEGHWQYELARDLRERGRRVAYPQLPDANTPSVDAWASAVEAELRDLGAGGRTVTVICHSLASLLWLGMRSGLGVEAPTETDAGADAYVVERVLLVAPPAPDVIAGIDAIAAFGALPLRPSTPDDPPTLIVAGDVDPFCPGGAAGTFGEPLGIPVVVIPGGAHLNTAAGYGHWPSVTAWCLDPTSPIVARRIGSSA